ncbi:putative peptidoglycan binding domain-containing protein [Kribbella sp. DT2]|uniref:putative peptidoglycan binding domain-containing protein n=1 Tax=Kribbella sp. DT2 TaxID=3393427 RepID=UPI003CF2F0B9
MADLLAQLGFTTPDALEAWAGTENFEERLVPGHLDPVVLDQLRAQADLLL